jgi:hypothetical protein
MLHPRRPRLVAALPVTRGALVVAIVVAATGPGCRGAPAVRVPAALASPAGASTAGAATTGLAADAAPPAAERRRVRRPRVGPRFDPAVLGESSALVASEHVPGLLWTVNDGGGGPVLLAVAADDGRALAQVRVAGARNDDWEALGRGPCRAGASACLYVGDVGDNVAGAGGGGPGSGRTSVTLYRVPEPLGGLAGPLPPRGARRALRLPAATARAEALEVRYTDGPRDVEAMAIFPDADSWLITKHPTRRADGTRRPALVYRVGAEAWGAAGPATARLVDSLPLVPDGTIVDRVTDAAFDPGRRLLAVRTYAAVLLVPVDGPPWRVARERRATRCDVGVLREPQGEGVAFAPGPGDPTLVLTSESNLLGAGGLATVACPPPRPPNADGGRSPIR